MLMKFLVNQIRFGRKQMSIILSQKKKGKRIPVYLKTMGIKIKQEMKIKLLILLSLGLIYGLKGQPVTPPSNSQPPTDERIRAGVLENGLTYYIKPTSDPREKISMYFTVK